MMKYAWRRSVPAERGTPIAGEPESRSNGAGASAPGERGRSRKRLRRLANVLIGIAVVVLLYGGVVLLWGDPVTGLYARWKQHQLSGELDEAFQDYAATLQTSSPGDLDPQELAVYEQQRVAAQASELTTTLKLGDPLGRLIIPSMGVNAVFVHGTRWAADLTRGPGHYPETELPGLGKTVAIAGHRTTFGAWFRDIDSLKAGDSIVARLPYATFYYRVFGHRIVPNDDWRIIRDRGFDALVLSACHPLYGASERWIVYAAAYRVDPVKGTPYLVDMQNEPRPLSPRGV
jgi:sortase A